MVLDRIADRAGWSGKGRTRDASSVVQGRFHGLDLILVKPLTFMNDSGLAVRKVLAREHAPLVDLLVVADDFALPFGKLRFREGGGAGGHNGLRSIIEELSNEQICRLRVGIGDPEPVHLDHVLSAFTRDEQARMDELLEAAADGVEAWAREGTNKAASRFNSFQLRPADAERWRPRARSTGHPARTASDAPDRLAQAAPGRGDRVERAADRTSAPARQVRRRAPGLVERISLEYAERQATTRGPPSISTRPRSMPRSRTPAGGPRPTLARRAARRPAPPADKPSAAAGPAGAGPVDPAATARPSGAFDALRERLGTGGRRPPPAAGMPG